MCSYATLPSTMPISTTCARTTLRPVGAMPGSRAGISTSWVKLTTSSSITRPCPTVRDTGHLRVGRPTADEAAFIERTHLVAAVAAGHHRHVRDVGRVGHRRHGGVYAALHKLGTHMGVEDRTRFLVHVKPPQDL